MEISPLTSLYDVIDRFEQSLKSLSRDYNPLELERWAMKVVDSMSGPARLYHRTDHVLELSQGLDPIGVLAALYHDLVYFQVDGGLPPAIHSTICQYFNVINGSIHISRSLDDPLYCAALTIFGFEPGQKLDSHSGQNEFLSALVALRELKETLTKRELVFVAACIEATIPFRAGHSVMEGLAERLKKASTALGISLNQEEVEDAVHRAVMMANRDVANFGDQDVGAFLDNTWKLLPESNSRLQRSHFYTIREYRVAIHKMHGFLSNLDPTVIFYRYKGRPSDAEYARMCNQARYNLELANRYLEVKLLTTVLLECLAYATGGDSPGIYLMGDPGGEGQARLRLEDHLPAAPPRQASDLQSQLLELFEKTKKQGSKVFDRKTSPLSAYIYRFFGDAGVTKGMDLVHRFVDGSLSCQQFIDAQPDAIVGDIASAVSEIARTRRPQLKKIAAAKKTS